MNRWKERMKKVKECEVLFSKRIGPLLVVINDSRSPKGISTSWVGKCLAFTPGKSVK